MLTPRVPFLECFPLRLPRRSLLPLVFRATDGRVDPTLGYGAGTKGLDADMERIRAASESLVKDGYLADDPRTKRLVWSLRRMGYDDALLYGEWRVELLYLSKGQPHFRLYYRGAVFGIVALAASHADLSTCRLLDTVRQYLAAYLVGWGWCPEAVTLDRFGAKTSYAANVDRQYRLFDSVATPRKSAALYDVLGERELA